jgi:uridine kinase
VDGREARVQPLLIGIGGGTGSGKTTIAQALLQATPAATCIDHDAYYRDLSDLPPSQRAQLNFDHPDALESSLLVHHLQALRAGRAIDKPIYDYRTHTRSSDSVRVEPAPVVIVEGILTLAIVELREQFDIRVFVDTDADIRLMRRVGRDLEERGRAFDDVREQYFRTVRPMHMAFVEPSKRHADVIIPEGGENRIAIDLLVGRIREHLRASEGER